MAGKHAGSEDRYLQITALRQSVFGAKTNMPDIEEYLFYLLFFFLVEA